MGHTVTCTRALDPQKAVGVNPKVVPRTWLHFHHMMADLHMGEAMQVCVLRSQCMLNAPSSQADRTQHRHQAQVTK